MPAWVIYAHFGALDLGGWVVQLLRVAKKLRVGGWYPRTSPCPNQKHPEKSFACGEDEAARPAAAQRALVSKRHQCTTFRGRQPLRQGS